MRREAQSAAATHEQVEQLRRARSEADASAETARATAVSAVAARAAAEAAEYEANERVRTADRAAARGREEVDDMRRRERDELELLRTDADAKLQASLTPKL